MLIRLINELVRRCPTKSHKKHYILLGDRVFSIIIDTSADNFGVYLSLDGGSSKPDLTIQEAKELDIISVKQRTFENGTSFEDYEVINATNTIARVNQEKNEFILIIFYSFKEMKNLVYNCEDNCLKGSIEWPAV